MDKAQLKVEMGGRGLGGRDVPRCADAEPDRARILAGDGPKLLGMLDDLAESLRSRHEGDRHRSRQRRPALPRAHPARRQRIPHRPVDSVASSAASPSCIIRRAASPSAAPSRSSAPRAASARPWWPTTSRGPSPQARQTTVIADLDLAFGTAGLDFNQDPPQGIAEAVFSPDRLDDVFLDRLLSKCAEHLTCSRRPPRSTAPTTSSENSLRAIIDIAARPTALHRARRAASVDGMDAPHSCSQPTRSCSSPTPDLANLRNAKKLIDVLRQARPNDRRPRLVINMAGVPKRPEIAAGEFAKALDSELARRHPLRSATLRNRGQQRPDDRRDPAEGQDHRDLPSTSPPDRTGRPESKRASRPVFGPSSTSLQAQKA